jgi:hypothetical protein
MYTRLMRDVRRWYARKEGNGPGAAYASTIVFMSFMAYVCLVSVVVVVESVLSHDEKIISYASAHKFYVLVALGVVVLAHAILGKASGIERDDVISTDSRFPRAALFYVATAAILFCVAIATVGTK